MPYQIALDGHIIIVRQAVLSRRKHELYVECKERLKKMITHTLTFLSAFLAM
jgi:hypothetical protein